jgi:hypothetical protein
MATTLVATTPTVRLIGERWLKIPDHIRSRAIVTPTINKANLETSFIIRENFSCPPPMVG